MYKKNFGLKIETHEDNDDLFKEKDTSEQISELLPLKKSTMKPKTSDIESPSRYFKQDNDRRTSKDSSEIELVLYSMHSSNKLADLSYHWFTEIRDLAYIAKTIKIQSRSDLVDLLLYRDLACEFKLLKLLTEDKDHKSKLIQLPKNMKRLNRYNDILPCKFILYSRA